MIARFMFFYKPGVTSRLWAQDAGEAEKAGETKAKWPGEPKQSPLPCFYPSRRADLLPQPESTALNVVDFVIADGWAP